MEGKGVAIVTGGSSGLGAETVLRLARGGYSVVNCDVRPPKDADGAPGRYFECDVADDRAMARAFDKTASIGPLRVAVSCAAILRSQLVYDHEEEKTHSSRILHELMNANLFGAFNTLRHAARHMCRQNLPFGEEQGVIVLTSSIAAEDGQIGQTAYSASKAAIAGMVLPAARELARYGIRVVAIAPGMFDTPMVDGLADHNRRSLERQVVYPTRFGRAEEFASLVAEIVRNSYFNGTTLRLDAGTRLSP